MPVLAVIILAAAGINQSTGGSTYTTFEEILEDRLDGDQAERITINRYDDQNRTDDFVIIEDTDTINRILADLSETELEEVPYSELTDEERHSRHTHTVRINDNSRSMVAVEIFESGFWHITGPGYAYRLLNKNEAGYLRTIEKKELEWLEIE